MTCKSWRCNDCVHYRKYLTISSMHVYCQNTENVFEEAPIKKKEVKNK